MEEIFCKNSEKIVALTLNLMTRKNGNIKKRRRKKSMDSKSSEEIESDKYLDLWLKA
jgi:hypothetical protein